MGAGWGEGILKTAELALSRLLTHGTFLSDLGEAKLERPPGGAPDRVDLALQGQQVAHSLFAASWWLQVPEKTSGRRRAASRLGVASTSNLAVN